MILDREELSRVQFYQDLAAVGVWAGWIWGYSISGMDGALLHLKVMGCLGVFLDSQLLHNVQVAAVTRKACIKLCLMCHLCPFLDHKALQILFTLWSPH